MVIKGSKTATLEDGNAVYAALLETPRGRQFEADGAKNGGFTPSFRFGIGR